MIDRIAQLLAEGANIVFDLRAFRALGIVKTINATAMNQIFINMMSAICELRIRW